MADGCTYIQNFAVSPDAKSIATLGNESGFAIWGSDGKRTSTFNMQIFSPGDGICSGIFGSRIDFASGTVTVREEQQESVWTFAGEMVKRTPMPPVSDDVRNGTGEAVTSGDGTLTAASDANGVLAVRRRDGEELLRLARQRSPAFSPDNSRLATVSDDVDESVIHIWELKAPAATPPQSATISEVRRRKNKVHLGNRKVNLDATISLFPVTGALSPDGRVAAVVEGRNEGELSLWRQSESGAWSPHVQGIEIGQLASADFSYTLTSLTFSPDNKLLASGGGNGTVKLWGLDGKSFREIVAHRGHAKARFSPDGRLLMTWSDEEGPIKLWSLEGELLDSLPAGQVEQAWFSDDGRWILATLEEPKRKLVLNCIS
jgi:WD40 repeat protein